jgi:membrane protease YdiL (CAAX protease family)
MTITEAAAARAVGGRARPGWAVAELAVAVALVAAGLGGYIAYSSTPWLLLAATVFFWWRGPGWRAVGLRRPSAPARVFTIGLLVGVAYQFVGLYVVEPMLARATSGELPDVSAFRSIVGDEMRLAFWLVLVWTLAAFMEELVFRGWIMTRVAEIGNFSRRAWLAAATISSALFGAVHLYQGVSGVVATGLTGLVFACLYFATGRNLWASILAHGFMDTAGFVMIYLGLYPGI